MQTHFLVVVELEHFLGLLWGVFGNSRKHFWLYLKSIFVGIYLQYRQYEHYNRTIAELESTKWIYVHMLYQLPGIFTFLVYLLVFPSIILASIWYLVPQTKDTFQEQQRCKLALKQLVTLNFDKVSLWGALKTRGIFSIFWGFCLAKQLLGDLNRKTWSI